MQRTALALAIIFGVALGSARAQSNPQFIAFQGVSKGALYKPDSGPTPHVGVLVMHRTANFLNHRACTELSRRGFLLLCMNTRYENNEAMVDFEKLPLDVKAGVDLLRRQPGITKVVLFAHSGGGPLMSPWQLAKLQRIAKGDFSAQFALSLALKDVHLALQAAGDDRFAALACLADEWQQAVDQGLGEQDLTVVTRALEQQGGTP